MQKDQTVNLEEAKEKLKEAGVTEDEMAALERQLVPAATDNGTRKVGFVSAGVESQSGDGTKASANRDDIELPEESDSDEDKDADDKVEIKQKDVPDAVFGGLASKRKESEDDKADESRLGALERIKRQRLGQS